MRFVADESVDGRVVKRLIADGHELVILRTALNGQRDPVVLAAANDNGCVLITEDKDFGELIFRLRAAHAGVILIRLHGFLGAEQAERVSQAVREQEHQLSNAFTVIGERSLRIRKV
ncbi:MAG: DUF5615 family PIN-like protein [Flavobacteriales bacterium]